MAVVNFYKNMPSSPAAGGASSSSSASVEDVIDSLVKHLTECVPVKELCCSEILKDEDLEKLDLFLGRNHSHSLQCLRLPKNGLTASSSYALAHIVRNMTDSLVELDLSENRLLGEGLTALVDALTVPNCHVRSLNLSNNQLAHKSTPALSSLLRNNTSIRDLSIAHNALGAKTIKSIVLDLCENETLERLDVSYNKISDRGTNLLAAILDPKISKLPLAELDLTYNKIGPPGVYKITAALLEGNRTLKKLNLSLNQISPEGAESFGAVLKFSHTLEVLNLSRNNVGAGVLNLLQGLQDSQETNLQILDLSWNSLTDEAAMAIARILRGNSILKSLNLASNAIGTRGTIALAQALPYDLALQELDIVGNQAEDPSAVALAESFCRPGCKLQTLRWEKNNFSVVGEKRLESAFAFRENMNAWLSTYLKDIERRRVLSLDLTVKKMGDDEVIAISSHLAKYKPRVTTLWLSGERITGRGIASLSRGVLASNTTAKVERLYLSEITLGDFGAAATAQALLTNTTIRVLSLTYCNLTADGGKMLANALRRNKTVVRINLRGNRIGDLGLREILNAVLFFESPRYPTLKSLNVSANGITDEGLSLSSPSLPLVLEELHLGQNQISDIGALELAKSICIASTFTFGGQRSTLRWLNLASNCLTWKGIQTLKIFLPSSCVLETDDQQHPVEAGE